MLGRMAAIDGRAWTNAVFRTEVAGPLFDRLGLFALPDGPAAIGVATGIVQSYLEANDMLMFVKDHVLNQRSRKLIARTFCYSFVTCYYEITLAQVDGEAVVGTFDLNGLKELFIDTAYTNIIRLYQDLNFEGAQAENNRLGIAHCFNELLSLCDTDFVATLKNALAPDEYRPFVQDWYGTE